MEAEVVESFELFKGVGILASLILVVAFQLLFPNRLTLRTVVSNWTANCPLALIDAALLSLLCGACVSTWAVTVRAHGIGIFTAISLPYWVQVGTTVVLLDLVAYLWHRANHRWRTLWRFHAVHHSDVHFDASTAFRFHPGELLISLSVRLIVVTVTGLPILGLIAFEMLYGFSNLFVHSDIRIGHRLERRLSRLFVTPSLHRMHHSERPEVHNTNFGTIFSCWDRCGRTLREADADSPVTLGLPGQAGRALRLWEVLRLPFRPAPGESALRSNRGY
jgi:sterol desaturase/sphingolipid hydroxylase (fatty acid hydroxylase superfamily)